MIFHTYVSTVSKIARKDHVNEFANFYFWSQKVQKSATILSLSPYLVIYCRIMRMFWLLQGNNQSETRILRNHNRVVNSRVKFKFVFLLSFGIQLSVYDNQIKSNRTLTESFWKNESFLLWKDGVVCHRGKHMSVVFSFSLLCRRFSLG